MFSEENMGMGLLSLMAYQDFQSVGGWILSAALTYTAYGLQLTVPGGILAGPKPMDPKF